MRASTWAWPSGESLGKCEAGCRALLAGSEKGPPRSAAATVACSFDDAAGAAIAPGATAATAEARAARRANSRGGASPGVVVVWVWVFALKTSVLSSRAIRKRPPPALPTPHQTPPQLHHTTQCDT